jgi:hypothetical protein
MPVLEITAENEDKCLVKLQVICNIDFNYGKVKGARRQEFIDEIDRKMQSVLLEYFDEKDVNATNEMTYNDEV